MAATNRPSQPPQKRTRRPTPKQELILKTKQAHPDLNTVETAALCNTDHSHVVKTLQRYGINRRALNDYKNHRADVFAGLGMRLITSVTDADIKKAPMGTRVLAAAQLYDKEQLERGHGADARPLVVIQINTAVDKAVDNSNHNNINTIEVK